MNTEPSNGTTWAFQGWRAAIIGLIATIAILVAAVLISSVLSKSSVDLAAWVQGTGTIMAIVAGFVGVLYQSAENRRARADEVAAVGRAAHSLAASAYELVTDRLNSALQPGKPTSHYSLRGSRTTEMVASMREFQAGDLPTSLIAPFTRLRACVFAINTRISEVYDAENALTGPTKTALKKRRIRELDSAVTVHSSAAAAFSELERLAIKNCDATVISVKVLQPLLARS